MEVEVVTGETDPMEDIARSLRDIAVELAAIRLQLEAIRVKQGARIYPEPTYPEGTIWKSTGKTGTTTFSGDGSVVYDEEIPLGWEGTD